MTSVYPSSLAPAYPCNQVFFSPWVNCSCLMYHSIEGSVSLSVTGITQLLISQMLWDLPDLSPSPSPPSPHVYRCMDMRLWVCTRLSVHGQCIGTGWVTFSMALCLIPVIGCFSEPEVYHLSYARQWTPGVCQSLLFNTGVSEHITMPDFSHGH